MMLDRPLRDTLAVMHKKIMRGTYLGIPSLKCPVDWWVYMEIVHAQRPDFIVEIGNHSGGTLLAFAHLLDVMGHGTVIGVDNRHDRITHPLVTSHPRIRLVGGDAATVAGEVAAIVGDGSVFVVEDSAHTFDNTLAVLRAYSGIVKPDGYLVVEDGIYGHGLEPKTSWPSGAFEAVNAFLAENGRFERDAARESFGITWNPGGFLRRVA